MNDERVLAAIKPHLKPGEHVTWCQPGPKLRLALPVLIPITFFAAWTCAALAFTGLTLWSGLSATEADWSGPAFGLVFAAIGAALTLWCWRGFRAGFNTTYAVTNQAALIIEDVWPRSVRRFTPLDVAGRARFGDRISLVSDAGDGSRFDSTVSFIGISDMAIAESALSQLATTHKD